MISYPSNEDRIHMFSKIEGLFFTTSQLLLISLLYLHIITFLKVWLIRCTFKRPICANEALRVKNLSNVPGTPCCHER